MLVIFKTSFSIINSKKQRLREEQEFFKKQEISQVQKRSTTRTPSTPSSVPKTRFIYLTSLCTTRCRLCTTLRHKCRNDDRSSAVTTVVTLEKILAAS